MVNSKCSRVLGALMMLAWVVSPPYGLGAEDRSASLLDPGEILASWTNSPEVLSPAIRDLVTSKSEEDPLVIRICVEGYRLYGQKSYLAGVRKFERAMELEPKNREARLGLATGLIKLDRHAAAIDIMEKMVEDFPRDYRVRNNLAWLYATVEDDSLRDPAKAVARAQEAVMMAPEDFHVWSTLSEAHFAAGNHERAVRAATEALGMARTRRAAPAQIEEYTRQWRKCKDALKQAEKAE